MRIVVPFRRSLQGRSTINCCLSGVPHDQRVPHRIALRCLRVASDALSDPALGLTAARLTDDETFDILEYILRSAPSLLVGVEEASRFTQVLHDGLEVRVRAERHNVVLQFSMQSGLTTAPELSDYALGSVLLWLLRASRRPIFPVAAHFRHPAPQDRSPYAELFSCPLVFEAEWDSLILPRADMERRPEGADPVLHALLLRSAPGRLASLSSTRTLTLRVRELVTAELRSGIPSLPRAAKMLDMSQRSLNRRLSEEGTTYRTLVGNLRRELALQYLEDTDLSVDELAELFGFSRPAAFYRAFRRWTGGETPHAYRARMRASAGKNASD